MGRRDLTSRRPSCCADRSPLGRTGLGKGRPVPPAPDSFDDRAAFIFASLNSDEPIGDFGYVLGGAVGEELDRYGSDLGTPDHALRLATSAQLDDRYQITQEELLKGQGLDDGCKARALSIRGRTFPNWDAKSIAAAVEQC